MDKKIRCSKCEILKPLKNFYKNKSRSNGCNSYCKKCQKEYLSSYYLKNRSKFVEKTAEWRRLNREKYNETNRQYHKRLDVRKKHRELNKKYRKTLKGKLSHIRIERQRIAKLKITDINSQWLTRLWDNTTHCVLCNKQMENDGSYPNGKHLDHILPICVGGQHFKNNVRFICAECNLARPKDGSDLLCLVKEVI